jgi:hypothetical protein
MLTYGVVLLYDNARPHIAARTRALLEHLNWELFDYPPSTLAPNAYHRFIYLFAITGVNGMCQNMAEVTGGRLL